MAERTTVRLPEDLVKRAKKRAAAEGTSMTALIEDGLRRVLNERSAGAEKVRVMPRVSKASGATRSGIGHAELSRLKMIEELEDLDYVERMNRGFQ
jgi:plasmid stability protein